MSGKLRIGLVGAGKFGGYHAGKLANQKSVDFAGIYDVDENAVLALANKFGVPVFSKFDELLEQVDALIIAAPAVHHGHYAVNALRRKRHLLIEKPMATELSEAQDIMHLARKHQCIVQVGHQERFVVRAIGLDEIPDRPLLIKAQRLSPYSPRGTDTSVTMDLMTHDIDLVLWLIGERPVKIHSRNIVQRSVTPDHVWAELAFEDCAAFLEASRIAPSSHRVLEVTYPKGTLKVDFNAKTLWHDTPYDLNENFGESAQAKDSLAAGLDEFVSAVNAKHTPFISAQDGLKVVEIALKIDR